MAKSFGKKETGAKKTISSYGSHESMVDTELTEKLNLPAHVICRDPRGIYITTVRDLDSGLVDQNRQRKDLARARELELHGIAV
jgi:hypothetical protein